MLPKNVKTAIKPPSKPSIDVEITTSTSKAEAVYKISAPRRGRFHSRQHGASTPHARGRYFVFPRFKFNLARYKKEKTIHLVLDNTKVQILKKVATQGYTTVGEVVKELGISWGAAQWHLFWLENNGYIKSVNINGTTIYILNCANVLRKLENIEKMLNETRNAKAFTR